MGSTEIKFAFPQRAATRYLSVYEKVTLFLCGQLGIENSPFYLAPKAVVYLKEPSFFEQVTLKLDDLSVAFLVKKIGPLGEGGSFILFLGAKAILAGDDNDR